MGKECPRKEGAWSRNCDNHRRRQPQESDSYSSLIGPTRPGLDFMIATDVIILATGAAVSTMKLASDTRIHTLDTVYYCRATRVATIISPDSQGPRLHIIVSVV